MINEGILLICHSPLHLWHVWKFRERERESRGEESKGNCYPPLYLDVFKISKGEWSN